jgi:hypothetical protein
MGGRTRRLAVAVSLTVLDAVVAVHYGRVVWRAFAGIIWGRLLLLLLAALGATSLLNLWVCAYYDLHRLFRYRDAALSSRAEMLPTELVEGRDV